MTLEEIKTQIESEIKGIESQLENVARVREELQHSLEKKSEAKTVIESMITPPPEETV